MEGVILFVDDKVHQCSAKDNEIQRTRENALFESLREIYPVLGVKDLDLAQRAIRSIGAFSAIILDWIFEDKREALGSNQADEDIRAVRRGSVQEDQTLTFLEANDFYALVYILSDEDVEGKYGARLRERFGDRITIQQKKDGPPPERILEQIRDWRQQHSSLTVPLSWTATINLAIQQIFKELAEADENWISEIGNSAREDGVNGEIFIIEMLQYLLTESLTQNYKLLESIKEYLTAATNTPPEDGEAQPASNEESVAKLFRRLFYTRIDSDAPIMTGDICQLDDKKFGIVVTPECDVKDVLSGKIGSFELLTFSKDSFEAYLAKNNYQRGSYSEAGVKLLGKLRKVFNQDESRFHVLPSFPIDDKSFNLSVLLDFSHGCERYKLDEIKSKRNYKLNSPFIQQLRQRYIAHLGRVGVPSLPLTLRNFNLK
jgi:hypothetical protein